MEELIGNLIVRAVPVALPAFMLIALLVHWGVLPDGTEKKSKGEGEGKGKEKKSSKKTEDNGGEE